MQHCSLSSALFASFNKREYIFNAWRYSPFLYNTPAFFLSFIIFSSISFFSPSVKGVLSSSDSESLSFPLFSGNGESSSSFNFSCCCFMVNGIYLFSFFSSLLLISLLFSSSFSFSFKLISLLFSSFFSFSSSFSLFCSFSLPSKQSSYTSSFSLEFSIFN